MPEKLTTKPVLTLALAKQIAAEAEAEALRNDWKVVIAIVDDGANLLYLQRMDGVQLASVDIAMAKATSAVRYLRPTKALEDALVGGRQAVMKMPRSMPIEGGLPLTYDGWCVGAIGVSGVRSDQDAQIAGAGMNVLAAASQTRP